MRPFVLVSFFLALAGCGSSDDLGSGDASDLGSGGPSTGGGSTGSGGATGGSGNASGSVNPSSGGASGKGGMSGSSGATGQGGSNTGSAGSGGGAGAGGSDGGEGHVIGSCSNLPAAGTWEDISPIPGNAPKCANCQPGEGPKWGAVFVVTHPNVSGTLYATVWNGGIWKSTDCGAVWTKANTGAQAATIDSGVQFVLRLDAGATDTLYSENWLGTNLGFFKSTNGGVDFQSLYDGNSVVAKHVEAGGFGNDIRFDPNDHRHLLINFHANCTAPYDAVCIGESKDGGTTWSLVNGPPQLTGWPEGSSVYFVSATSWLFGSHLGLFLTPDAGATWNKVAQSANIGGLIRSPSGTYYLPSDQGILQSQDMRAWSLVSGSPAATGVVGTGKTLYAGLLFTSGSLWSAPEDKPTVWSKVPMPTTAVNGGAWQVDYDADHHVLYAADNHSGLWRFVAQ